jgi:hypothetical protein
MGFIQSLFILLFGGADTSSKQKRALRQVAKEITQNKYRNFYGVKGSEIRRHFGVFFYDLYKALYPTANVMHHAEKSGILKHLIVERFLSKGTREVYNHLTPEAIAEQAKTVNPQELAHQIEEEMNMVSAEIRQSAGKINRYYRIIAAFVKFARFDFFSCLKKFDSQLREGNTAVQPQFRSIPGKYVAPFIKEFLALPFPEAGPEEWKVVFDILKDYKSGVAIIDLSQWKKLLLMVQDVLKSQILVLMIRHIDQNPEWNEDWEPAVLVGSEDIVSAYLRDKTAEVKSCISKLMNDKHLAKREALAKKLFGDPDIIRLHYYTHAGNEALIKKNLNGFAYIAPLNYMMAFFKDRQNIRDLCDMFVIRGHWTSQELSRQVSKGLHETADISADLTAFDESLSDRGVYGNRIKTALNKSALEKTHLTNLKGVLDIVNGKAQEIITHGIVALSAVKDHLKDLYDDCTNGKEARLVNWKELESLSEHPLAKRLEQGYMFIEDFVSLLRLFVSENL